MGCDIHTITEVKTPEGWKAYPLVPPAFDWRSYGLFGFLADVRNYSEVPPLMERREWPDGVSDEAIELRERWCGNAHSYHWLTVAELVAFDYSREFADVRGPEPVTTTIRDFLLTGYFAELERLKALGDEVRILMFFDN